MTLTRIMQFELRYLGTASTVGSVPAALFFVCATEPFCAASNALCLCDNTAGRCYAVTLPSFSKELLPGELVHKYILILF